MSVRYLNATGTQTLINLVQAALDTKASTTITTSLQNQITQTQNAIPTQVSQLTNDAAYTTSTEVADTYATKESIRTMSDAVQANTTALTVLNGDATVEGSVDYKIAEAVAGDITSISIAEIDDLF